MLHLTDEQKVAIDVALIRLVAKGTITVDQKDLLMAALLNLRAVTESSEQQEQDGLNSLVPSPEELARIHKRTAERNHQNAG
ncbi:MAG TPA: hypothetical protein VKQ72_08970 [Aggregatilineales bacterium]|nr:hypothetical protein [Aggregatilineales bacterium]